MKKRHFILLVAVWFSSFNLNAQRYTEPGSYNILVVRVFRNDTEDRYNQNHHSGKYNATITPLKYANDLTLLSLKYPEHDECMERDENFSTDKKYSFEAIFIDKSNAQALKILTSNESYQLISS